MIKRKEKKKLSKIEVRGGEGRGGTMEVFRLRSVSIASCSCEDLFNLFETKTDRQTDRQTHTHARRQKYKQTDRQTYR